MRTLLLLIGILVLAGLFYIIWSPGQSVHDGRHDLRSNGVWIQHGWLGDDPWFARNQKDKLRFRDSQQIWDLANLLASHGVTYVFPHLCPCGLSGEIASVDDVQAERFLDGFELFKVVPWVGGVLDGHCFLESSQWRSNFVASVVSLFQKHPRFAGIQLNIEPLPSGNDDFLLLLKELRQAMPAGKILSVAAYPPPTKWQPLSDIHWDESYFRQVAQQVDQMVVMMYDTAIRLPKIYQYLMSAWTREVLAWAGHTEVLLGVPAYDDAGVGYHNPKVENIKNSLLGIHAGLSSFSSLPANYKGISIYCEWEMDEGEWQYLTKEYEKSK